MTNEWNHPISLVLSSGARSVLINNPLQYHKYTRRALFHEEGIGFQLRLLKDPAVTKKASAQMADKNYTDSRGFQCRWNKKS